MLAGALTLASDCDGFFSLIIGLKCLCYVSWSGRYEWPDFLLPQKKERERWGWWELVVVVGGAFTAMALLHLYPSLWVCGDTDTFNLIGGQQLHWRLELVIDVSSSKAALTQWK